MIERKLTAFADAYGMLPEGCHVAAAVSGGADSVCLMALLADLAKSRRFTLSAMHYNHNLRGSESDGDAAFTAALCQQFGIPCRIGSGDVAAYAAAHGLGTEEAARQLRYAFFEETAHQLGADRIATAHTADDNAETVLMNLTRGTGLQGLCGIPPVRDRIIRPMLTITRQEIEQYLTARGILHREDSSNSTDLYTRNIVRHHVVPVLEKINPAFTEHVAAMTTLARRDQDYLRQQAAAFYAAHFKDGRVSAKTLAEAPAPIAARAIAMALPGAIGAGHIDAVRALAASADPSGRLDLPGITVRREYGDLVFGHAPASETFRPVTICPGQCIELPEAGLRVRCDFAENDCKINKSFTSFLFKCEMICGMIMVRPRQVGDAIAIPGRSGTKTLKKLLIEQQIPRIRRELIPVIADEQGVLGVYGVGIDRRAVPDPETKKVIKITFEEII